MSSKRTRKCSLIHGGVAQLVRAPACHAGGQGFEPPYRRQFASVAQLVEQGTENPRVVGSIPTGGTIYADLAHLVERRLAKAKVAGSSPVIRSRKQKHMALAMCFCFLTQITEHTNPRARSAAVRDFRYWREPI